MIFQKALSDSSQGRRNPVLVLCLAIVATAWTACPSSGTPRPSPSYEEACSDFVRSLLDDGRPLEAIQAVDAYALASPSPLSADSASAFFHEAAGNTLDAFREATNAGDWRRALSLYRSLDVLGLSAEAGSWSPGLFFLRMAERNLEQNELIAAVLRLTQALDAGVSTERIPAFMAAARRTAQRGAYLYLVRGVRERFGEEALAAAIDAARTIYDTASAVEQSGLEASVNAQRAVATEPFPWDAPENDPSADIQMDGTVTVWVDRGIRLEEGLGIPDRVVGSAFFIDRRGYLITNHHVIASEVDPEYEGYSELYIRIPSRPAERIPARVVGYDRIFDIALLKTEITPQYLFPLNSDTTFTVGDHVYAIGSPAALENTVTSGIVSAASRRFLAIGDAMQVDVPVNPGNSGGPLLDENGLLVGVVFAGIEQFEGVNFAVPFHWVMNFLPDLFGPAVDVGIPVELGVPTALDAPTAPATGTAAASFEGNPVAAEATHSWMGLSLEETELGLRVVYVMPDDSGDNAGLRANDIVIGFNGRAYSTILDVQRDLILLDPGTLVRVSFLRDGAERETRLVLGTRPYSPLELALDRDSRENLMAPLFGMTVEQTGVTLFRKNYVIREVIAGSIADEAGFSVNDSMRLDDWEVDEENRVVFIQIFVRKRTAGFLESTISIGAPIDVNSFI